MVITGRGVTGPFEHYFGSCPGLPAGFGTPPGLTQPNGQGGTVKPFQFTSLTDNGGDPNHDWDAIHSEWDNGKMDGFYTTNGKTAMGVLQIVGPALILFLFPQFTLCANYFCGVLSETYPNRLVLYSGTSGGNTSNNINNGTLNYPCVLDLLSGNGITFKNYNFPCLTAGPLIPLPPTDPSAAPRVTGMGPSSKWEPCRGKHSRPAVLAAVCPLSCRERSTRSSRLPGMVREAVRHD